MAYKGGLRKWFKEDWRDVATGKPCGRKSSSKSKENIQRVARRRQQPKCQKDRRLRQSVKSEKPEIPEENLPLFDGPFHPLDVNKKAKRKKSKA